MARFYELLAAVLTENQPFALGIISGVKGSSPQKKGAKALFLADGRIVGTLGGGCLEAEIQDRARRALVTGKPATFDLLLDHDFGWDDGLLCGGGVSGLILPNAESSAALWLELAKIQAPRRWGVKDDFSIGWVESEDLTSWQYQETVAPPFALWIAGSGHIAQAVAPLALQLDFDVTVFDDRPALANHKIFPTSVQLRVGAWEEELLKEPMPQQPAFGLVVTRGHQHDALVLANWVHRPFVFLGMIGSKRKARLIREQFLESRIASVNEMDKVNCPVGLDIEAQGVTEIAVSILAQYIQKRAHYVSEKNLLSRPRPEQPGA